jgi:hypothetical protein
VTSDSARLTGKVLLLAALLLVTLYGCFKIVFPSYANRFRLTIAVNIDGQTYTGSSVIEVRWQDQKILPASVPYAPSIRGQAVFIDLGQRGAVVAALNTGERSAGDNSVGVEELAQRAFSTRTHDIEVPDLPGLTGRRDLAPDNMPRLIWFNNVDDERSAHVFTTKDLPGLFGPTARLDAAFIEITTDPIVVDIDRKLPWYRALADRQKGHLLILQPVFQLKYNMFVGESS